MSYEEFQGTSSNCFQNRRSQIDSPSQSPSNVPETRNPTPPPIITIEEFVSQLGRQHIPRLHPEEENGVTWFGLQGKITNSILNIFKTQLNQPWPTYGDVDEETKKMWFKTFAKVRRAFDIQAMASYQNHMYTWKQKWKESEKMPKRLNPEVWQGFIRYWSMDETISISSQASTNRRSKRGGKGIVTHNGGSISFKKHKRKMMIANGGVAPDWIDVMETTHTSKKTGQIQDPVVGERIERIKLRKMERLTQLSQDGSSSSIDLPREEINRLRIKEIPLTKSRRSGLGSHVSQDGSISSAFLRDNELIQQIQDLNLIVKEKDEAVKELMQKNLKIMKQFTETQMTLSQLQSFISSKFPGQFPPP